MTRPDTRPPASQPALFGMAVTVCTEDGRRFEYEGLYSHTFAAYDDALARFAQANRIEVKPLHAQVQQPTAGGCNAA